MERYKGFNRRDFSFNRVINGTIDIEIAFDKEFTPRFDKMESEESKIPEAEIVGMEGMEMINLMPYTIECRYGPHITVIKPSYMMTRLKPYILNYNVIAIVNGIPVKELSFDTKLLPAPEKGKMFILPFSIATKCGGRNDILTPDEYLIDEYSGTLKCHYLLRP